jgi:hypothetical protein
MSVCYELQQLVAAAGGVEYKYKYKYKYRGALHAGW